MGEKKSPWTESLSIENTPNILPAICKELGPVQPEVLKEWIHAASLTTPCYQGRFAVVFHQLKLHDNNPPKNLIASWFIKGLETEAVI